MLGASNPLYSLDLWDFPLDYRCGALRLCMCRMRLGLRWRFSFGPHAFRYIS